MTNFSKIKPPINWKPPSKKLVKEFGNLIGALPEKVLPEIVEIPKELKAKMPEKEWLKSITPQEQQAYYNWGGGSDYIREFQRTGKIVDFPEMKKSTQAFLERLEVSLDRGRPYDGIVWRGLHPENKKILRKIIDASEFRWDALSSSTYSEKIATRFAGENGIILKIHNKSGIKIDKLVQSEFRHQKEVILRNGAKYRRISGPIEKSGRIKTISGEVKDITYYEIELEEVL